MDEIAPINPQLRGTINVTLEYGGKFQASPIDWDGNCNMDEPVPITVLSGYDPIELSIGASRLLNTDATEHELARLINSELERGVLVAYWQRLSNGVYGYYVRMAEL
jgi:hypothetical protein